MRLKKKVEKQDYGNNSFVEVWEKNVRLIVKDFSMLKTRERSKNLLFSRNYKYVYQYTTISFYNLPFNHIFRFYLD